MRSPLLSAVPLALLLLSAGAAAQTPVMPAVIETSAWGGETAALPMRPQRITHITLHHQGETWKDGADVEAYLRRLQQWSRLTKRWADIPYHYVIAPDGRIYAARPEGQPGDTNTEYDPSGHALIMVLGNFEEVEPSTTQLRAIAGLMTGLAVQHGLAPESIASHKDYSAQTVCPGRNLYRYLENGWLRRAVAAGLAGQALPEPRVDTP
jgi:hypothetical protein